MTTSTTTTKLLHLDVALALRQVVRDPSDDVAVARVFGVLLHRAFLDDHLRDKR